MKTPLFLFLLATTSVLGLDNNRSPLPPMGWNPWYQYEGTNSGINTNMLTATIITNQVQAMLTNGWLASGYKFICMDAGWQSNRNGNGEPIEAPAMFPSGVRSVVNYIHAQGLKWGYYFNRGTNGDFVYPNVGSYANHTNDARYSSTNGGDYLKFDLSISFTGPLNANNSAQAMYSSIILQTNQPVAQFGDGVVAPGTTYFTVCNAWRGMADIMTPGTPVTFATITNRVLTANGSGYVTTAGQQSFNDFDFIVIGMTNNVYYGTVSLAAAEKRSYFGMWCMEASPLILSSDLTQIGASDQALLQNPNVIAIDQDPLCQRCTNVTSVAGTGGFAEAYSKYLSGGSYAVALWNEGTVATNIGITWASLNLPRQMSVYDCWNTNELGVFNTGFNAYVPSHDCLIYIVHSPLKTITFAHTPTYADAVAYTNLIAWYYAPSIIGADGTTITNWPDRAPGGTNWLNVAGIGAGNPILKTNIQNGLNVVRFGGTGSRNNGFAGTNSVNQTTPLDVYIVFRLNSIGASQDIFGYSTSSGNAMALGFYQPQDQMWDHTLFFGNSLIQTNMMHFRWNVSTNTADNLQAGNARDHWINARKDFGGGATAPATVANLIVGIDYNGGTSNPLNADVGEIRVYNRALSPVESRLLFSMMGTNWGLTLNQ